MFPGFKNYEVCNNHKVLSLSNLPLLFYQPLLKEIIYPPPPIPAHYFFCKMGEIQLALTKENIKYKQSIQPVFQLSLIVNDINNMNI